MNGSFKVAMVWLALIVCNGSTKVILGNKR